MPKKAKPMTSLEKARAKRAENLAKKQTMAIDPPEPKEVLTRASKQPNRTPPRQSEPRVTGRAVAQGRDGEQLMRSRTFTSDQFEIPTNMIPKGWSYQWNTISVVGNEEVATDYSLMMQQNGWRPVPAERYAGTLLPQNAKGSIIRGGQRLEERPTALTDEARDEDVRNAKQLISDRNESLKLSKTKQELGPGFEMSKKYRGTGGDIRMTIDASLDAEVERPSYKLADEE